MCSLLGVTAVVNLGAGDRPLTWQEETQQVFRVDRPTGQPLGSCWPVARVGKQIAFVTARHVASDEAHLVIAFVLSDHKTAKAWPVLKRQAHETLDLALLWIETEFPIQAPRLRAAAPAAGTKVYVAGFPLGRWLIVEGLLAGTRGPLRVSSAVVAPGTSGGKALAQDGTVVGLVIDSSVYRLHTCVNRGPHSGLVPARAILGWLRQLKLRE